MKICQYLRPELINSDLKAQNKEEVLTELADQIAGHFPGMKTGDVLQVLLDRERLGSTGIGNGIGIPHGKLKGLETLLLGFGISRKGVDFESMDNRPTCLFFLLITPENSTGPHLKLLARISKILKSDVFKEQLMNASDRDEIYNIIKEADDSVEQ